MMDIKKWFSWGLVITWMAIIFIFSAQQGADSGALSGSLVTYLQNIWEFMFPKAPLDKTLLHVLIRKGAHFTVYLILGWLTANALYVSGVVSHKRFFYALLISFLYAFSDEIHQAFVPNRGPSFWDVLLDTAGASVGVLIDGKLKKLQRHD